MSLPLPGLRHHPTMQQRMWATFWRWKSKMIKHWWELIGTTMARSLKGLQKALHFLVKLLSTYDTSLRKQPTFRDAFHRFPAKRRLGNERRNSILMTRHYPDLDSASDWSCRLWNLLQPISSTTQIWVVTCHQYGISALVSETSFRWETVLGGVAKCRLLKL